MVGRKYLKGTYDPWNVFVSTTELNTYFSPRDPISGSRLDFFAGGPGKFGAVLFSRRPDGTSNNNAGIAAAFTFGLTLPGYNSEEYFQQAAHISGRYVFGGTKSVGNLFAATHGNDETYFATRTKFFSFDSYSRYATNGDALENEGYFLPLTPVGGACILRFVILTLSLIHI